MKTKKVGTFTLAIGLIILGLALFANNFTNIKINDIYKYWPVLLIGVGIEIFVNMIILKHEENIKLRVDGLCIAFIIVAFLFAGNIGGFNFGPKFSFSPFNGNILINGVRYKSELKETIVKDNISKDFKINKLTARNSFGDIKLLPYDQAYIKVEAIVTIRYNDEKAVKEYIKDVVKIIEGEQTQVYSADYNGINKNEYARAKVDYIIYVPSEVYAEIHNSFGDIDAQGVTKDLNISGQNGDVTVKDVGGSVSVKNSFGEIEVKGVGGKLEANNQYGDIDADLINGGADLETGFGELEISNVSGPLIAKNNYGRITAKSIKGDAQIKTSFGNIEASNIEGNTVINDNNGEIEAKELKGNVEIRNSFGKISYRSSNSDNADIYAKTSFGNIKTDLPLNITKAINDQTAQGKLGDGKYKIEIITNNGEIELE
ncbi:MAG: hypothetical protein A2Y23_10205 [Clostridiales bacterium GWB2_37_7]|nr:MAG: hypothetical protein A2Y23_10205 [Clostridiales bacterium GWB2_37_7]